MQNGIGMWERARQEAAEQCSWIHGITHLQNPRSRSDQRRQGDTEPCRKFWCSLRALGSDVDPLRCFEIATRDFSREPCNAQDLLSLGRQLGFGLEQVQKEAV